jgi:hypothetical protein
MVVLFLKLLCSIFFSFSFIYIKFIEMKKNKYFFKKFFNNQNYQNHKNTNIINNCATIINRGLKFEYIREKLRRRRYIKLLKGIILNDNCDKNTIETLLGNIRWLTYEKEDKGTIIKENFIDISINYIEKNENENIINICFLLINGIFENYENKEIVEFLNFENYLKKFEKNFTIFFRIVRLILNLSLNEKMKKKFYKENIFQIILNNFKFFFENKEKVNEKQIVNLLIVDFGFQVICDEFKKFKNEKSIFEILIYYVYYLEFKKK